MKHASLPIVISMTLIWLSEGERIFGGLSVKGAVERHTEREREEHIKSQHLSPPMDSGSMINSLKTTIKAELKMGTNTSKYNI